MDLEKLVESLRQECGGGRGGAGRTLVADVGVRPGAAGGPGGVDVSCDGYRGGGSSTRTFHVTPASAKTASAPSTKPASPAPITMTVEWRRAGAAGGGAGLVLCEVMSLRSRWLSVIETVAAG
ncbi:hypothetical protein AWC15_10105 [Mycobacterium lacus]|nr:hypothetical protein AWC15_10105 [Mycobacterium lacus]